MASPLTTSCTGFNFILPFGSQSLENISWPLLENFAKASAEREGSKEPTEGGRADFLDKGQDRKRKRKRGSSIRDRGRPRR